MKTITKYFLYFATVFGCFLGICATSCSDDIPADKYYTFTGEMLSDYLTSRPQFSEFVKIMDRAQYSERGVNLMDLVATYGQFTCFAPDNDAVAAYLEENGYETVSDIPYDICDTIARTHLVNGRAFGTEDLLGATSLSSVNMNDRYLQVQEAFAYVENGDTIYTTDSLEIVDKEDIHNTYRLNRSGYMYFNLCNDSVENGLVHVVNGVIASSNQSVFDLIDENPNVSLFAQAMRLVGISEYIQGHIKDATWDPDLYEDKSVYSGAQWDYCHIPESKNFGFTVFACPDSVLKAMYNIETLQDFYDYALGIYGGDELDVNDPENAEALTDWRSPLRRLIGYNILKQKGMYSDLTSITTIETTLINPTEWYATMDSLTTIKIERLTVTRFIGYGEHDTRNDIYLNRGDMSRGCYTPGIHVDTEIEGDYVNEGSNGVYYTTDGLADYGEVTKQDIFNTRMRMDLYYMFPELMSNNVRDGRTNNYIANSNNPDKNVTSPNYWFPNGYLDNVKVNDDGIFLFQSQHNTYWSYEGDEFNLASDVNSYDITFNLPSVPTGTYQIRLGFAPMSSRGICQFYLDGEPQGIPFDMRDTNFEDRSGFFALTTTGASYSSDELEQAKKNMHNMGWYHGPRSVFNFGTEGTLDGANATKNYFCNNYHTMRYVLCTANLDEDTQHTVRIKSIWAVGTALVMIDYLELVPKSVYGVEGEGKAEDDY
ncbi:MAG: fasciclin domain-containing protein [Prevotellaceae bacterium]|nr:fasciclin domain-containing protein [Prevotellaceae bacterium]